MEYLNWRTLYRARHIEAATKSALAGQRRFCFSFSSLEVGIRAFWSISLMSLFVIESFFSVRLS